MVDPSTLAVSSTTMWAFFAGWFTPASLFLLLNLVIGTILISSRFHSPSPSSSHPAPYQSGQQTPSDLPPLARSPSLLDRVRSINFSAFKFDHHPHYHYPAEVHHHYPESVDFAIQADPAPSLLQRLKSINFNPYVYNHPRTNPEPDYAHSVNFAPPARAPSLIQRLKSINLSQYWFDHPDSIPESDPDPAYPEPAQAHAREIRTEPPPLAPVPSFLERVKSINFSLYGQEESDLVGHVDPTDHHVKRVKSQTRPRGGVAPESLPGQMRKSASDKSSFGHFKAEEDEAEEDAAVVELRQRPETAREQGMRKGQVASAANEAEEIDAKADDFINRFKQQLKLQRLDSIMRYKEMLSRGSAS